MKLNENQQRNCILICILLTLIWVGYEVHSLNYCVARGVEVWWDGGTVEVENAYKDELKVRVVE